MKCFTRVQYFKAAASTLGLKVTTTCHYDIPGAPPKESDKKAGTAAATKKVVAKAKVDKKASGRLAILAERAERNARWAQLASNVSVAGQDDAARFECERREDAHDK